MKGIVVNCKTGKVRKVDDGLPFPETPLEPEKEGVDLDKVSKMLKDYYKEPK